MPAGSREAHSLKGAVHASIADLHIDPVVGVAQE